MSMRTAARLILLATVAFVATSCAHASGDGVAGASVRDGSALCDLRVASGYDVPIEAGVRAGAEEVSLGVLKPRESVQIRVPCSFGAVTVFRLVERGGPGGSARLTPRTQALDPHGTTTVTVRPAPNRAHLRSGN